MSGPVPQGPRDLLGAAMLHGSVAVDYGLRTGLATAISAASMTTITEIVTRRDARRLAWYADMAGADRDTIFPAPAAAKVRAREGSGPGVADGRVELLAFDTPYVALNPLLRADYARHANNAVAHAQHWRHASGPRPTLVVVHGFGASPAWFNVSFFGLRDVFRDGWDILLYKLPFHGSRRGDLTPINGIELFAHGMAHFTEAMLHAVYDLRVFLDHLARQGVARIGLTGLSLGGYVTALSAAIDPRLDFAVPNSAVIDLPRVLTSWFPANHALGTLRALGGLSADTFADAIGISSPLSYAPLVARDRRMIVAGLGDRLAPPEQSLLLWEHWERPRIEWFPGSHVLHVGRENYRRALRELMLGAGHDPAGRGSARRVA
ncbi:MAG: alpha/beta hydrolase family protein [Solirubrobacteraceae bacterium]